MGFIITKEGLRPDPDKVDRLLKIALPKTLRQLRRFVGIINYYKSLYFKRSHKLYPLLQAMSPKEKFKFTPIMHEAFKDIKHMLA